MAKLENMKTEQKSKHGGAREGAGRKPRLQYEARELFYNAVDDRWNIILSKLDQLIARGDFHTLRWILEQRIGRPPQSVDITTQGEAIMPRQELKLDEDYIAVTEEILRLQKVAGLTHDEAVSKMRKWARS